MIEFILFNIKTSIKRPKKKGERIPENEKNTELAIFKFSGNSIF